MYLNPISWGSGMLNQLPKERRVRPGGSRKLIGWLKFEPNLIRVSVGGNSWIGLSNSMNQLTFSYPFPTTISHKGMGKVEREREKICQDF